MTNLATVYPVGALRAAFDDTTGRLLWIRCASTSAPAEGLYRSGYVLSMLSLATAKHRARFPF